MLVHRPLVSGDLFVHPHAPRAVNSVGVLMVKIPTRGRRFSHTRRLRCRRSGGGSTTLVERLVVVIGGGGRPKERHNELHSCRVSPISAAEVEGSFDVDGSHSHTRAAFEVESVQESAALLPSDTEAAAPDGEWQGLGRDGGVERLSTSSSRGGGIVAFNSSLETLNFGAEFETIESVEWPVTHEDTVSEGQLKHVEELNDQNGNVPHPEINNAVEEEEEGVGRHTDELPSEEQKTKKRGALGVRKPSQESPARIDSVPRESPVKNISQRLERLKPEPELQEDLDCYIPKVGDEVIGVVVSGNENQIDIDIGAKYLGRLLSKDVKPLDSFRADEFFWELEDSGTSRPSISLGQVRFLGDREPLRPAHPLVPVGTVLSLQVYGVTLSGRALLSAREIASRIAWQRVRQIHEQDEPIATQCVAWNSDGLVFKIEGLRAVLPFNEFLNRSAASESLKGHVGEWRNVLITDVDEATGGLLVSEKRAWGWRHLRIGSLVNGTVQRILPFGVEISLTGTSLRAMLHISSISHCYIPDIRSVFTAGENVKALVIDSGNPRRIGLSTADLESTQGLILQDKERVFQEAEEMAARHRSDLSTDEDSEDIVDVSTHRKFEEPCSANDDWLDFGEREVSVLESSLNKQA